MKLLLLAALVILLTGCGKPSMDIGWSTRIPPDKVTEAADWVIKAVAAPAPADKDPEDRLEQATKSASILFGRSVIGIYTDYHFTPYEDTQGPARALLDEYLKNPAAEKP